MESEFGASLVAIEWHVAQGLSNPYAITRRNGYGLYGTPTAWFDGASPYSGDANVEAQYRARVQAALAVGGTVAVEAAAMLVSGGSAASVAVTVTLAPGETVPDPAGCLVRVALFEEGVSYCCDAEGGSVFPHVGRVVTDGVVLDLSAGDTQVVDEEIALGAGWMRSNLRAVAFVQRTADRTVLNTGPAVTLEPTAVEGVSWGRLKAMHRGR